MKVRANWGEYSTEVQAYLVWRRVPKCMFTRNSSTSLRSLVPLVLAAVNKCSVVYMASQPSQVELNSELSASVVAGSLLAEIFSRGPSGIPVRQRARFPHIWLDNAGFRQIVCCRLPGTYTSPAPIYCNFSAYANVIVHRGESASWSSHFAWEYA